VKEFRKSMATTTKIDLTRSVAENGCSPEEWVHELREASDDDMFEDAFLEAFRGLTAERQKTLMSALTERAQQSGGFNSLASLPFREHRYMLTELLESALSS
jgi:hypothetical protein